MLKLLVDNVRTTIQGALHPVPTQAHAIHEALRHALSYEVVGAEWSAKYKEGNWDGRISLYNRRHQQFPAGLTGRAIKLFEELEIPIQLVDTRKKPPKDYPLTYDFGDRNPRFYQEEIAAIVGKKQRGVVAAATGAGKTMASCLILSTLQVKPVVFIVPAIELLRQTQKEFEKYLRLDGKPVEVGIAGGGVCKLNMEGVNVITYQTALAAFNERYMEKSKKVVQEDDDTKSVAQLEAELEAATRKYEKAVTSARAELKPQYQEIRQLEADLAPRKESLQGLKMKTARQEAQMAALRRKVESAKQAIADQAACLASIKQQRKEAPRAVPATEVRAAEAVLKQRREEARAAQRKVSAQEMIGKEHQAAIRTLEREIKIQEAAIERLKRDYKKQGASLTADHKIVKDKAKAALDNRFKSLEAKRSLRELLEQCRAMIVDEAHVAAVVIEALGSHASQAYYRLGLSATPWRTDNQEIRIEGSLGKKIYEISASDLIDMGFLVPPKIYMCHIAHVEEADTYQDIYDKHVVRCWERNCRIKQFAETFKAAGRPVLILVERRDHGHLLESMIKDAVFVPGGDKGEDDPTDEERNYRRRMLNAAERNEIVLIATQWANVGVDAPAISTLILAGSGQSSVTTYQQAGRVLRCLGRNAEESAQNGKAEAVVIDFMDSQKNLRQHSTLRKKVYERERSFACTVVK